MSSAWSRSGSAPWIAGVGRAGAGAVVDPSSSFITVWISERTESWTLRISRSAPPTWRPTSGRRFGPNTTNATTRMTRISAGPRFMCEPRATLKAAERARSYCPPATLNGSATPVEVVDQTSHAVAFGPHFDDREPQVASYVVETGHGRIDAAGRPLREQRDERRTHRDEQQHEHPGRHWRATLV